MDNLEHIFNEELNLDEGLFASQIGKVKDTMGTAKAQRQANRDAKTDKVETDRDMLKAQKKALNNKDVKSGESIKRHVKTYMDGVVNLIKSYDAVEGDYKMKVKDANFRKHLIYLKTVRKKTEALANDNNYPLSDKTKKVFNLVKNNKIEELRKLFNSNSNKFNDKSDEEVKSAEDMKPADTASTSGISSEKQRKVYMDKFSEIFLKGQGISDAFGNIADSMIMRMSLQLNEDINLNNALWFFSLYYEKNPAKGSDAEWFQKIAKKNPIYIKALTKYYNNLDADAKEQVKALAGKGTEETKEKEKSVVDKPAKDGSELKPAEDDSSKDDEQEKEISDDKKAELNKLGNDVVNGLKSMGYDKKQATDVITAILRKYPEVKDAELIKKAIVKLSDGKVEESILIEMALDKNNIIKGFAKTYNDLKNNSGKKSTEGSQVKTMAKKLRTVLLKTNKDKREKYTKRLGIKVFKNKPNIKNNISFNDILNIVTYMGNPRGFTLEESLQLTLDYDVDTIFNEAVYIAKDMRIIKE